MSRDGGDLPSRRPLLRAAPVKVRGILGPQPATVDGRPTGRSRGTRAVVPTAAPEPLTPPGTRRPYLGPAPGAGAFRAGGGVRQPDGIVREAGGIVGEPGAATGGAASDDAAHPAGGAGRGKA